MSELDLIIEQQLLALRGQIDTLLITMRFRAEVNKELPPKEEDVEEIMPKLPPVFGRKEG